MTSQIKTVLLLALLSAIIIGLGGIMGGRTGIIIAFVIAMIMNVGSYWYSDKIVLSMYQARELSEDEAPMLHRMVAELSANAGIPKPRVCVIPEDAPNAFATGRDPEHGVVAVTDGIMRILSPEELRGVIAHEIGHIANRDILIQTIAGVLASVIVSIANFMQFAAIFGGSSNDEEGGTNPIAAFLLAILAPIAASIIQMAISRSREYLADETGARICGQPPWPVPCTSWAWPADRSPCRTATPAPSRCSSSRRCSASAAAAWPTCSARTRRWKNASPVCRR